MELAPWTAEDNLIGLNRSVTTARLLAGTVHEVNNALQIIAGTAELLASEPDLPQPIRGKLERVLTQSAKAANVVNQVLTFARGRVDDHGPVNVREVVLQAIRLRDFAVRRAGLTIDFVAAESVDYVIQGCRALVEQAILNLIINAEQAMAPTRTGTIRIALHRNAESMVLRVSDTGPGVPAELADRIFAPFVTTRPAADAAGLGLAAATRIAQQHGGSLIVEHASFGASFVLRLAAPPAATPGDAGASGGGSGRRL